jgi:primosomal protein N'
MARCIIRDTNFEQAAGKADALADRLGELSNGEVVVSTAAACVLPRIADRFRFDVTITASTASELQTFLIRARKYIKIGRDIVVDVDPISLL